MPLRVYAYEQCDSCRKALRFLRDREIAFELFPIREQPPSLEELKLALKHVGMRRLFNTSGRDYRALGIGEQLPGLSESDALALLARNGNLVKRPFLADPDWFTAGFKEEDWVRRFGAK